MSPAAAPGERAQRAEALSRIITERDQARRAAELAGDLDMRNLLAGENVRLVAEAPRPDLNSLVLRWMLQRTRWAAQLADVRDALAIVLGYATNDPDYALRPPESRAEELGICAEILGALERTLTEDAK
jgi:hypothetical protein